MEWLICHLPIGRDSNPFPIAPVFILTMCVLMCITSCGKTGECSTYRKNRMGLRSGEWTGRLGAAQSEIYPLRKRKISIANRSCEPNAGQTSIYYLCVQFDNRLEHPKIRAGIPFKLHIQKGVGSRLMARGISCSNSTSMPRANIPWEVNRSLWKCTSFTKARRGT